MESRQKKLKVVLRSAFILQIHHTKARIQCKENKSYIVNEHATYIIGTAFLEDYKLVVNVADFDKACTTLNLYKTLFFL